jgi:ribonuclease BN (tRNA processing enzyme)
MSKQPSGAGAASLRRSPDHDHSSGEVVGRTATAAGVPKLVLYHLVPRPGAQRRAVALAGAPYYAGEIIVGRDLLEF